MATGIILAGGKSRRFGEDKTLYRIKGRTMVERAAEVLRTVADEVLVSVDRKGKFCLPGVREVLDIYGGIGPVGGIYTGLLEANGKTCIIIAGDNPQIDRDLTQRLLEKAGQYRMVVPVNEGRAEPLYGVYKRELLPVVKRQILLKRYGLQELIEEERKRGGCYFYPLEEEEKRYLYNVNSFQDIWKIEGALDN